METTLEALEEAFNHPIYNLGALRAAIRWARACKAITRAQAAALLELGQAKWKTPIHHREGRLIAINQIVEFVAWDDELHHKDGPDPGDTGLVVDVQKRTIDVPDRTVAVRSFAIYEVVYRRATGPARTIWHFSKEIRALKSKEKTP